jgi:hypothetical protein
MAAEQQPIHQIIATHCTYGNNVISPRTTGIKFGDKRGTQPPTTPRTALQKKSQFVIIAQETTCFSDIVGILENTLVAEEGLMAAVV